MADFETPPQSVRSAIRARAAVQTFHPYGTVRCEGEPLFRNQHARDLACLLDIDDRVEHWRCLPLELQTEGLSHVPDFLVKRVDGEFLIDVLDQQGGIPTWPQDAAERSGYGYLLCHADDIGSGIRLQNAKDLLRYARWHCPLGDRVRLLAALDECALPITECLQAFRETSPIAGLSSLILKRFISVDLDGAPIGPETIVTRWRD